MARRTIPAALAVLALAAGALGAAWAEERTPAPRRPCIFTLEEAPDTVAPDGEHVANWVLTCHHPDRVVRARPGRDGGDTLPAVRVTRPRPAAIPQAAG